MVSEQELKARLEAEIAARQRGETGTKPKGGFIAEVEKAKSGKSSVFTTTPSPKVPTEAELKAQLQKEIEIRQAGGTGTQLEGGFISYVENIEKQRIEQTKQEELVRQEQQRQLEESRRLDEQRQKAVADMESAKVREEAEKLKQQETQRDLEKQAILERERTKQQEIKNYLFDVPFIEKIKGTTKFTPAQSEKIFLLEDIKTKLRTKGMPGKVVGEFIPTSTGDIALVGGLTTAAILAPPVVGAAIGLGIGGLGTKAALSKDLEPEQRIAGALGGALGFLGAGTVIKPYVKGQLAKTGLLGKYEPVKTAPEGYRYIEPEEVGKVGIIPKANEYSTENILRAEFQGPQTRYLGGPQTVGTGQVSFFKTGKEIPLDREFFVSPQEPALDIALLRESRMGLIDLFKMPEARGVKLSVLGPGSPQAGLETGAVITKTGKGGTYRIGTGSELEATRTTGAVITDVEKIGVTVLKGQAVDIFKFKTTPGPKLKPTTKYLSSSSGTPTTDVSIFTPVASLIYPKTSKQRIEDVSIIKSTTPKPSLPQTIPMIPPSKPSKPSKTLSTPSYSSPTNILSTPSIPKSSSSPIPSIPSIPSSIPSEPSSPVVPSSPFIPPSKPSTPSRPPRYPSYPSIPPSRISPPSKPPYVPKTPTTPPSKSYGLVPSKRSSRKGSENVFVSEVRRFGKWMAVSKPTTYKTAYGLGVRKARRTLGVSVRLKKAGQIISIPTPRGFVRGKKEPYAIIEQRRYRLKKFPYRGEVSEIQMYRKAAARKQKVINFMKTQKKKKMKWF